MIGLKSAESSKDIYVFDIKQTQAEKYWKSGVPMRDFIKYYRPLNRSRTGYQQCYVKSKKAPKDYPDRIIKPEAIVPKKSLKDRIVQLKGMTLNKDLLHHLSQSLDIKQAIWAKMQLKEHYNIAMK